MSVILNPYLSFRGNAREAMEFYRSVFGGELTVATFADFHAAQDAAEEQLVMHSQLAGDHGVQLMGSDLPERMPYDPGANSFSVSLSGDDEATLTEWYEKLSAGGTVSMPLAKAPWGDTFGMLADKFGINWVVNIAGTLQA